ncbi:MAG: hypothetical protein QXU32_06130 [Nitrososphaerales archaeon]
MHRKREQCAVCGNVLKHKHRPMVEWGIDGFLCGDCHIDKMKEFYVEGKKLEADKCELCGRKLDPKNTYELHRGLNLKSKICVECFEIKSREMEKKLENCATCGKKLGFFRYNPKREWNVDGQLCRKCWDIHNRK